MFPASGCRASRFMLCIALASLVGACAGSGCATGSVRYDPLTGKHHFRCLDGTSAANVGTDDAATGTYDDESIAKTGWGALRVTTHAAPGTNATQQAFAAGMLEGRLTQRRIFQYWSNYAINNYGAAQQPCDALATFMRTQQQWLREKIDGAHDGDEYWGAVGVLMAQFDGLVAGYAAAAPATEALDAATLYLLGSVGDLETLNGAVCDSRRAAPKPMEAPMLDCSALIRLLPARADVLAAHTTWRGYYAMLRIWKTYDFASFLGTGAGAGLFSIASSPGLLHSKDDFYARGDGLVTMETTNGIYNHSLLTPYALLPAKSVLTWQRATVANWLATGGRSWTTIFARHNSGTYDNQWMALDGARARHQMQQQEKGPSDWLWILEQIPGMTQAADVTSVLRQRGFWPSYNIPYFSKIYSASGYEAKYEAALNASGGVPSPASDSYSYSGCPRARIFARDAPKITDLSGMRAIMTYNNYETDPLALGSPSGAVAARGDLPALPSAPLSHRLSAGGAVDAKVVSIAELLPEGPATGAAAAVHAICGPTHAQQPPFAWATAAASITDGVARDGVPAAFDFDWATFPLAAPQEAPPQLDALFEEQVAFWQAFRDPATGCYCDTLSLGDEKVCGASSGNTRYSSASTGMGLVMDTVLAELGLLSVAEAEKRALQTLASVAQSWPREVHRGFWVHWTDQSWSVMGEFSTVDSAELVAGALFAGNFYAKKAGSQTVKTAAAALAAGTDWAAAIERADGPTIFPVINGSSGAFSGNIRPFNEYYIVAYLAQLLDGRTASKAKADAYFKTYFGMVGAAEPPEGRGGYPVLLPYNSSSAGKAFALLTDNPSRFMSSFIPLFCSFLTQGFSRGWYAEQLLPSWRDADQSWWADAIPAGATIWNASVPAAARVWGAGAGQSPTGYGVDRIGTAGKLVASPAIMAGFLVGLPHDAQQRKEINAQLEWLHANSVCTYIKKLTHGDVKVLWRCSILQPEWRARAADSIDWSTLVLGYATNFLPDGFYAMYAP